MIVINIKLANKNKLTFIGHYRQWNIPMTPHDIRYNGQTYRYDRTLKTFNTYMKDNNDVIIVGDDNIDTLKDNNKYNIYNNFELKDLRDQFLIDSDMTQHNFKPTFTRAGIKSCIDHIYSNCSYKITDVVTQRHTLRP